MKYVDTCREEICIACNLEILFGGLEIVEDALPLQLLGHGYRRRASHSIFEYRFKSHQIKVLLAS